MLKFYCKGEDVPSWLEDVKGDSAYSLKFCRLVVIYARKGKYNIRPVLTKGYTMELKGNGITIIGKGVDGTHKEVYHYERTVLEFVSPLLAVYGFYKLLEYVL